MIHENNKSWKASESEGILGEGRSVRQDIQNEQSRYNIFYFPNIGYTSANARAMSHTTMKLQEMVIFRQET